MELMDVVDEKDTIVGKATQEEIYEKELGHRIVHVLLFDRKGRMALQRRSKNDAFCPNHWSTAVGGHVRSGESYEEAALREYREELGTESELTLLGKEYYNPPGLKKHLTTFTTTYEGPFKLGEEEVEHIAYFTLEEIENMIKDGEHIHPELLFLLKKHFL